MELTSHDLLQYAAGKSDPETVERILKELENPESEASRFVNEMVALTEQGVRVDWGRLLQSAAGPKEPKNG